LVIQHLKENYPNSPLFCIGYSMGANILLKYLGESRNTHLTAAVSISNLFSYVETSKIFEGNFIEKKLYNESLASDSRAIALRHYE
jgi:uncharacterized protein